MPRPLLHELSFYGGQICLFILECCLASLYFFSFLNNSFRNGASTFDLPGFALDDKEHLLAGVFDILLHD